MDFYSQKQRDKSSLLVPLDSQFLYGQLEYWAEIQNLGENNTKLKQLQEEDAPMETRVWSRCSSGQLAEQKHSVMI